MDYLSFSPWVEFAFLALRPHLLCFAAVVHQNGQVTLKCSVVFFPSSSLCAYFRQQELRWPSTVRTWVIHWAKKMILPWLLMARRWSLPFPLRSDSPFWTLRCHVRQSSAAGREFHGISLRNIGFVLGIKCIIIAVLCTPLSVLSRWPIRGYAWKPTGA